MENSLINSQQKKQIEKINTILQSDLDDPNYPNEIQNQNSQNNDSILNKDDSKNNENNSISENNTIQDENPNQSSYFKKELDILDENNIHLINQKQLNQIDWFQIENFVRKTSSQLTQPLQKVINEQSIQIQTINEKYRKAEQKLTNLGNIMLHHNKVPIFDEIFQKIQENKDKMKENEKQQNDVNQDLYNQEKIDTDFQKNLKEIKTLEESYKKHKEKIQQDFDFYTAKYNQMMKNQLENFQANMERVQKALEQNTEQMVKKEKNIEKIKVLIEMDQQLLDKHSKLLDDLFFLKYDFPKFKQQFEQFALYIQIYQPIETQCQLSDTLASYLRGKDRVNLIDYEKMYFKDFQKLKDQNIDIDKNFIIDLDFKSKMIRINEQLSQIQARNEDYKQHFKLVVQNQNELEKKGQIENEFYIQNNVTNTYFSQLQQQHDYYKKIKNLQNTLDIKDDSTENKDINQNSSINQSGNEEQTQQQQEKLEEEQKQTKTQNNTKKQKQKKVQLESNFIENRNLNREQIQKDEYNILFNTLQLCSGYNYAFQQKVEQLSQDKLKDDQVDKNGFNMLKDQITDSNNINSSNANYDQFIIQNCQNQKDYQKEQETNLNKYKQQFQQNQHNPLDPNDTD
ncbi:hypothetical protein PPERSA_05829 [Pseudocohnilembus persalinus]|uniref:Uncharacterized protein n=1 Tax=Pseudocohnilembus persalinus TaxID=266149 RepID=A0A0V0QGD4_PSEPJ|nr:hypothetical protein PPERSA_05829 [Pseudocohnilembus persalinus]|eukprot:KRX01243.1 hypothetical protein PPERSA_05829 [Pseudocohnilembus persalinus]